jgi:hypothetical protein
MAPPQMLVQAGNCRHRVQQLRVFRTLLTASNTRYLEGTITDLSTLRAGQAVITPEAVGECASGFNA